MVHKISLESEHHGKNYIIHVSGVITAETLEDYRKYMDILIDKLDVADKADINFILDYSGVTDVDSSTLANILDRLKNDVRADHEVAFVNVNDEFRDLVTIHKLDDKIRIFETVDAAIAELDQ